MSRRFPLVQISKTRMIDDFSVSGVTDSCVAHNRADFHLIDTFYALVKFFFGPWAAAGKNSEFRGKTYDLTSAYRQVSVLSGDSQRVLLSAFGQVSSLFSCQRSFPFDH